MHDAKSVTLGVNRPLHLPLICTLAVEFDEISMIGKHAEQAGKLGKKLEWQYMVHGILAQCSVNHILYIFT